MVKRTRIDELEGAERLVRQRVTDGNQFKIKAEQCADFILDKGDAYLSERIDTMDCEAVTGLQDVFVICRYDLDDVSMKISPFFEAYVSQLNDTIREAERSSQHCRVSLLRCLCEGLDQRDRQENQPLNLEQDADRSP